uniref:Uncharacterized protein n=1 Tax=Sus scrofa TaxID=9823 RepID=A0A8D1QRM9_PIG
MGATAADRDLDLQAPPHLKGQDYSPTAAAAQLPVAVSTAGIGRPHVSLPLLLPASSELREHFPQLGYVIQCTVPFHKEIDFPRGTAWIQCPSGELPTALQQENHVINGVNEAFLILEILWFLLNIFIMRMCYISPKLNKVIKINIHTKSKFLF